MTWADLAAFLRDLAAVGTVAAALILAAKLIRPGHAHDRLAAIALGVATLAATAALALGPFAGGRIEAWALCCAPVLLLYWWLEADLGTRILGLAAGIASFPAIFGVPADRGLPLADLRDWGGLAEGGALVGAGLMAFAASNLILAFFYRQTGAMNARKTGRYFAVNAETIAEIIYRLVAWSLPFAVFALLASGAGAWEGRLSAWVVLAWAFAALTAGLYAWRCRRQGYEVGLRPGLLLLATAGAMGGLAALGMLGSVF